MQRQLGWLKAGFWGAVVGSILTMVVGFSWGGWMTGGTAHRMALTQADAAVTTTLVPICLADQKADIGRAKKLGELAAITSPYERTEFVMKAGWATFPGQNESNRAVAEACGSALLNPAVTK